MRCILVLILLFSINVFAKTDSLVSQIKQLESVQRESPQFASAMLELQKKLYIANDWDYFFGLSQFITSNDINISLISRERSQALEMLALSKHCRFDDATQLAKQAKIAQEVKLPLIDEALKVVQLQKVYELKKSKGSKFKNTPVVVRNDTYWSINKKQFMRLSHPKNIRKSVKSLCVI